MKKTLFSLFVVAAFIYPSISQSAPALWTCPESYYSDGWCDVGCDAYDVDCDNTSNPKWNNCQNGVEPAWGSITCYEGGVRGYVRGAFGGDTLEHTYPCRVDSGNTTASYCELSNVWGECPSTSTDCPDSWVGDGWCDPACMNDRGSDGGDCAISDTSSFYCFSIGSSNVLGAFVGGGNKGADVYYYDAWFAKDTRKFSQATLESKIDYAMHENGECDLTYGIDGVCHQHTNRILWFGIDYPAVIDWDVAGSSISDDLYGQFGGGWGDCRSELGIN